jgi:hypothetical protein
MQERKEPPLRSNVIPSSEVVVGGLEKEIQRQQAVGQQNKL